MERRNVLAAITAAIATPAHAWVDQFRAERVAAGEDPAGSWSESSVEIRPDMGLTALQADVRKALQERLLGQLELLFEHAGAPALVDTWLLSEALLEWQSGGCYGDFCGLANAMQEVLARETLFVAVPESLHGNVQEFIEGTKDANERVISIPREIEGPLLDVMRCLLANAGSEVHVLIQRGPHAPVMKPRKNKGIARSAMSST